MKTLRNRAAIVTIAASSLFFSAAPALADSNFETPVQVVRLARVAPADEYFGPLRLSVLGISNTIARTTLRLDNAGLDEEDATRNVGLVEASVRDWEAKYPDDTWLPRMVFALHRAYRKISTAESLQHAADTASWLITRYPGSLEARAARAELARAMATTDGSGADMNTDGDETAADGTHP